MSLGPLELAMIAAIALLFFGPAKLPQLGKSIGEAIRGFKGAMNDMNDEINKTQSPKKSEKQTSDSAPEPATSDTETEQSKQSDLPKKEKDPVR